jgi:glyoxylase-like metal-dependent hydrolase (beta-lactamase superfamily II)
MLLAQNIWQAATEQRHMGTSLLGAGHSMLDGDRVRIGPNGERCISGDMMLPRISTNVSVYEQEPEADSLKLFLDSIDKFKALPPNTLVLPSHGKPFTGMHQRIVQLHNHHRDRLAEVLQTCTAGSCSAADVMPVLFTCPMDLHQTTFAMGESIAHLHYLWYEGKLVRALGENGVYRFGVA